MGFPETDFAATEVLLAEARSGDPSAWERFVERYERLVWSVPRRMGFSEADAADIAQEAWVLIHRHLEHLRRPEALVAWIVTTTTREASRFARRRSRRQDVEADGSAERGDPTPELPDEQVARLEAVQLVRDAIAEMDERCSRLLGLIDLDGSSYEVAASELDLPLGSVGPTRMRCLGKLLPTLRARGLS